MTTYESWSLGVQIVGIIVAIAVICVAIFQEKIRQWFSRPQITLSLIEPNFTSTNQQVMGWYYLLKVESTRPAPNGRVMMTRIFRRRPDDSWIEQRFSGPTQVLWQWPDIMPMSSTLGSSGLNTTFAAVLQDIGVIELRMYWFPNNLPRNIEPNDPTRLCFKAVSDMAESKEITIEIAWEVG
jgi:hypothetical protein